MNKFLKIRQILASKGIEYTPQQISDLILSLKNFRKLIKKMSVDDLIDSQVCNDGYMKQLGWTEEEMTESKKLIAEIWKDIHQE